MGWEYPSELFGQPNKCQNNQLGEGGVREEGYYRIFLFFIDLVELLNSLKLGLDNFDLISIHYIQISNSLTKIGWKGFFPGGAVVENLPANAGDTGSSPGLGKSHMPRSNYAREPQLLSLRVWSLCSATREAAIVRGPRTAMKSGPRLPQLEKALAQKRRPNTAKNK